MVPLSYDATLARADLSITGRLLPFDIGRAMKQFFAVDFFLRFAYDSVVLTIGSCLLAAFIQRSIAKEFCIALLGSIVLGYATYYAVPACGPKFFVTDFPLLDLTSSLFGLKAPHPMGVNCVRNAIPSLHMTWALICLVFAWQGKSKALLFWTFLNAIFTALATMGMGEHYMVDLLVALPFSVFLVTFSSKRAPIFYLNGIASLGVFIGWLAALRFERTGVYSLLTIGSAYSIIALVVLLVASRIEPKLATGSH